MHAVQAVLSLALPTKHIYSRVFVEKGGKISIGYRMLAKLLKLSKVGSTLVLSEPVYWKQMPWKWQPHPHPVPSSLSSSTRGVTMLAVPGPHDSPSDSFKNPQLCAAQHTMSIHVKNHIRSPESRVAPW
ncbi:unnamed protein product [Rangifer tarandus platyrhynchus]|uniref:Uncharacterized protein n=1 Tax=Rangifer tarandus platyrhynchus TaxID=3082113 RepID=A0AC59ZZ10_RANTA